jgi:hypothetical protein
MQKAMDLMNLKLKNVIDQLHGISGLRIVKAILEGERNAAKLASLCEPIILRKKEEQVISALKGNFKEEYVFMLRQAFKAYLFYQSQMNECDKEIEKLLTRMLQGKGDVDAGKEAPSRHNQPNIEELHNKLVRLHDGKNPTVLPGISDMTMLKLTAELGCDFTKWPTEKHFTSWMGLSPKKHQSGKTNKTRKQKVNSKAGQIFRESAMSIANSKYLALKGFYARIKSKHGARAANKATARKLADLYYRFMTKGIEYVETGLNEYEKRYKELIIRNLTKKAKTVGYQLIAN